MAKTELNEEIRTSYDEWDPEPMSDEEIEAWLAVKIESSLGAADGDVSETRQKNLEYYTGKPYGDERDGYSKVVTMEGFEAVEWALPSLIRTFTQNRFAAFIPRGMHDEAQCEEETDVVNNIIMNHTNVFEWAHAWMKDTLIYPNGYVKVFIDEARDLKTVHYERLTMAQVMLLQNDKTMFSAEVEEAGEMLVPGVDPESGQPMPQPIPVFNVKGRYLQPNNEIKVEAVPPEEVLVDNDLRGIDLDESEFVCHHREVTRSELVAMGYDKELVWSLPISRELKFSTERESRADFHDEDPNYGEDYGAMEKVDFYECYAYLDADDDGYAEYMRFDFAARSELLNKQEWDYQPLVALSCYPQPHRHTGMSMLDISKENQRVNSVLKRQILDNLYRTNRPRQFAGRGVDIEQLMNYTPHGVVEVDDVSQIVPEQIPVVVQQAMPFMEFIREELDRRTGISRHAAGLDAETLASSTMGAYLESLGQASQRLEMLARNWAETGFKKVALKVHHLLRTRQNEALTLQVHGQWKDVDPRQWSPRHQMAVKVGVGTGSVKEKLSASMQVMEVQERVQQFGLANARTAFSALKDLTSALGMTDVNKYFVDPEGPEYQQWLQQQDQQRQEALQMQERQFGLMESQIQTEAIKDIGRLQLDTQREENRKVKDTAQMMLDADETRNKTLLDAAKIELDHGVDIEKEKVGITDSTVTPLRTNGGGTT